MVSLVTLHAASPFSAETLHTAAHFASVAHSLGLAFMALGGLGALVAILWELTKGPLAQIIRRLEW